MNERNVTALAGIVDEFLLSHHVVGIRRIDLADFLASRGVLVPSALTDDEVEIVRHESTERYEGLLLEDEFRYALTRIAKGETA